VVTEVGHMSENELKHMILRHARLQGWAVYHVPQTRIMNGGGKGYPDLTLARDKEVLWIEVKDDRGMQTSEQRYWEMILPAYHLIRPKDWPRVLELLS
jgi:hypothetical protein